MTDKDRASASGTGLSPEVEPFGLAGFAASIPDATWTFEFLAAAGSRVLRSRFMGINCGWADRDVPDDDVMWWDSDNNIWRRSGDIPWGRNNPDRTYSLSSYAPCRSFAAFKRHLRRHPELNGRRVVLVSRFIGRDVVALPAQRIEARTATTGTGVVHESLVANGDAPNPSQHTPAP